MYRDQGNNNDASPDKDEWGRDPTDPLYGIPPGSPDAHTNGAANSPTNGGLVTYDPAQIWPGTQGPGSVAAPNPPYTDTGAPPAPPSHAGAPTGGAPEVPPPTVTTPAPTTTTPLTGSPTDAAWVKSQVLSTANAMKAAGKYVNPSVFNDPDYWVGRIIENGGWQNAGPSGNNIDYFSWRFGLPEGAPELKNVYSQDPNALASGKLVSTPAPAPSTSALTPPVVGPPTVAPYEAPLYAPYVPTDLVGGGGTSTGGGASSTGGSTSSTGGSATTTSTTGGGIDTLGKPTLDTPNNAGISDALFKTLMDRANQDPTVKSTDPAVRAQTDAYDAAQQRSRRDYLRSQAESQGIGANIGAETRASAEQVGQNTAEFEATLMGRELTAKRDEIKQALDSMQGLLTDEQKLQLTKQLADLNRILAYAQLNQQGSQFNQSQAQQNTQFNQTLTQQQQQFLSQLLQRAFEFDTNTQNSVLGA